MAVYKEKNKTWTSSFYYKTWSGTSKRKHKRGFRTKKEAQQFERDFLSKVNPTMDMTLKAFVDVYFKDKKNELKKRSIDNKKHMIEKHIIPYLGELKMDEIGPSDIIQWQDKLISVEKYQPTYLRMIQNQLSALFNHAARIYGLNPNPCSKVKKMGKSDADEMKFWTKKEYMEFISNVPIKSYYYTLFELLFYTGCRLGEVLALTPIDINFNSNEISIDKTYHRSRGEDIITAPKTENSIRKISIPEFLSEELKAYMNSIYGLKDDCRLFPVSERAVQIYLSRHIERYGLKKIRVHDLRHSHVALLIDQGVDILLIKQRLGHKDIGITINTYGHLYPNKQKEIADLLDSIQMI